MENREGIKAHLIFFKRSIDRLYDQKRRCSYIKDKDYPNYGGRGIKHNLTLKELRLFLYEEAVSRGFDLENPKDCVDFLDTYQVDRINGRGDYELGNIRLLEARHNQYLQSQEVRCIRLTEDLWTPCFLIDSLTASPNKHLSKRIYRLLRMGHKLNVSLLGMAQDYLNLYWYDFATPPLEIIENKNGRLIKCKCGDYHKIEKPTKYKCAILSGINYKNSRLMIPTYEQLKESEAVLQKYVRAFK